MELTPKVLTTVEFTEKRRGYDPDEVRAFLLEVARAMEGLHQRVRDAEARATDAQRQSVPPPPPASVSIPPDAASAADTSAHEHAEQARRTLVLAQRTADAAVAEARDEAGQIRTDAEAEARRATERAQGLAERALREAQARAATIVTEADEQARNESEALRATLRDEVTGLTAARDARRGDVERLEAYLEAQRERMRTTVDALQHVLDHPEALSPNEVPVDTEAPVPQPTPRRTAPLEAVVPDTPPSPTGAAPTASDATGETVVAPGGGADVEKVSMALEPTMALPAVQAPVGEAPVMEPPAPSGQDRTQPPPARRRPDEVTDDAGGGGERGVRAPDPSPEEGARRNGNDDRTVIVAAPTDDRHDPLLPPSEPDPFEDEQLVRNFFDPRRHEGRLRRRRD